METVIIFPIGGLLVAFGVIAVIGIIWLWNAATENIGAISQFANESSDTVIIVIGIFCLAITLLIVISSYCEVREYQIDKKPQSFFIVALKLFGRALLMAAPYTLGFSAIYAWCLQILDAIIGIIAESVLMWISVPLVFIFGLVGIIVGLAPMIGLLHFAEDMEAEAAICEDKSGWLMVGLEALGIAIYLFLIFTCTDLPEYLANSFSAW